MPLSGIKVASLSTWNRWCGIADYSKVLWPEIDRQVREKNGLGLLVPLDGERGRDRAPIEVYGELEEFGPDIIHFQHEFGIWGGALPPWYRFPRWVENLRKQHPEAKFIATAHSVRGPGYRFPNEGRGWQTPLRWALNATMLSKLRPLWGEQTWGLMDGVVVHSSHQQKEVQSMARKAKVVEIDHFVPAVHIPKTEEHAKRLLLFGFFSPEKGQDIAIRALAKVSDPEVRLVLAGGHRRKEDRLYFDRCRALADDLGIGERVTMTGYVDGAEIDGYFARADLVVAPFRDTSGSGSITQAFSRGAPVLASDLPLNREVAERTPGAVALFKSEDPLDCARQIERLLANPAEREKLRAGGLAYASERTPEKIAARTIAFYRELLG